MEWSPRVSGSSRGQGRAVSGGMTPACAPMIVSSATIAFPPGVTLTAIDGGNTYYADNGYTYAADSMTIDGVTYANGWDDEKFFPIAFFLEKYRDSTDATKWNLLNANTAMAVQGDVSLSAMNTNQHQLFIQAGEWITNGGNNLFHATLLANVVGIYSQDEPSTTAEAYGDVGAFPNSGTPVGNTGQDNRMWGVTFTHNQLNGGDIQGTPIDQIMSHAIATPNATTRTLTLPFLDEYFFNGAGAGPWPGNANGIYGRAGSMTADLMSRGSRYNDITRFIRLGNPNHSINPFKSGAPMGVWVETGACYSENIDVSFAIRPAEINAAVWGSLIGGARFVLYFTPSGESPYGQGIGNGLIDNNGWDTPLSGESISNQDQVQTTNDNVRTLAPILNSPFAVGYLTVSPSEQVLTSALNESGYATMVKYYNRGASADQKFYIFALPRYGNRTHNNAGVDTGAESWPKTATFTIPNTGATQATVMFESRTVSITGGGTTFQDSFAAPETVHIYRID